MTSLTPWSPRARGGPVAPARPPPALADLALWSGRTQTMAPQEVAVLPGKRQDRQWCQKVHRRAWITRHHL